MTEVLAELLKLAGPEEVDKICYLSLGRLAPFHAGIEFNLAEKMMIRSLAMAYRQEESVVRKKFKSVGDLGDVAAIFDKRERPKPLSVVDVFNRLEEIAAEAGEGSVQRKIKKMSALLGDLDASGAKYVVRIPLGRLRLGFSDKTILDALSWMASGDKSLRDKIEAAYNVRTDVGMVAKIFKLKGLKGLKSLRVQVGVPVMPALCQRLPTTEKMIEKMCRLEADHPRSKRPGGQVAAEPKYDGTRVQIHLSRKKKPELVRDQLDLGFQPKVFVRVYTRNLEDVTHMFPDLVQALSVQVKAEEIILDGEAIGFDPKTGRYLPFQQTIKRKRKHGINRIAQEIPLRFIIFDLMFKDGQDFLKVPFKNRRRVLEEAIDDKGILLLSPQLVTDDPEVLRRYHGEQFNKGLEGIVVKKWDSPYDPGKRGYTWVKLKQEKGKKGGGLVDTLDCSVMGYYAGRGKRAEFGIGMFLVGILSRGKVLTVSKIGTGLSDGQWREMKKRSKKYEVKNKPKEYRVHRNLTPDVWLRPGIVVEIEADNITKSPVHSAGFALRFPRLVRFRDDKSPSQSTTLGELNKLYRLQK